uniref:Uncharacterized protein n=1 Tax=Aegilops tauschii subsp. strangulata TaxID=200361 RepID=A0A453KBB8_AEGTS
TPPAGQAPSPCACGGASRSSLPDTGIPLNTETWPLSSSASLTQERGTGDRGGWSSFRPSCTRPARCIDYEG